MSADIRSVVVAHPVRTSLVVAPTLAFFALSPTPHLVSVIALVATLRVWSWSFVFRTKDHWHGLPQLLAVAFAGALASLRSSLGALSTPSTSMIVLSAITSATSLVALSVLVGAARFDRLASTPWSKITLFPAVWASTWGFVSYVSPVGQLATWSPVLGLGSYQWIRQFMGQVGIDWIVAAWAAVASEIIGDWLVGSPTHAEDENPQVMLIDPDGIQETPNALPQPSHSLSHRSIAKLSLTAFLITLMLPSNFLYDTPLPAHSPETTYFTVGCALPLPHRTGHRIALPTLDDYILETKRLQSPANIVLWPETAVRFDSPAAKEEAFSKIQDVMNHGKYVGVSFEDYVPSEVKDGVSRRAMRRNGFALIGFKGEPVLEYYKRNLVPS